MLGGRGGFLVVVVVPGVGVTGAIGRFISKTNLWLNLTAVQLEIVDSTGTTDVNQSEYINTSPSHYSML